jgi:elongation factor P
VLEDVELLEECIAMIPATQIKKGMVIIHNGELHQVVSFHHVTPGNWRGMVQTKLRNLKTGSLVENRFRSEDRIDRATLEQHEMEYLYQDGDQFCFDLPMTVDLEVVETEPGIKGATATRTTKPATLETGLVVQVPVFIDRGDVIRVDTTDKKYLERANK